MNSFEKIVYIFLGRMEEPEIYGWYHLLWILITIYIAYVTIIGSIVTLAYPRGCFAETILVNIHTMYLHCGSLVLSIYLLMTKEVKIDRLNLKHAYQIYFILAIIAEILNIALYKSGILNGEYFNLFYISPYFSTTF